MATSLPHRGSRLPAGAAGPPRRVADVMTRGPAVATLDTTVAQAFRILTEGPLHHLPVVDAQGRLVGMLADRDLLQWMPPPSPEPLLLEAWARLAGRRVGDLMVEAVLTAAEDDPLELAVELMAGERLTALAVVGDDGRPVGVLALEDVADALAAALRPVR